MAGKQHHHPHALDDADTRQQHSCHAHSHTGELQPVVSGGSAQYTCPMHPEIIRDQPGDCPICGMALEPMIVTAKEAQENPELVAMTRRFRIAVLLSIPLVVIAMGDLIPGKPRLVSVMTHGDIDEARLLRLAATLENASEHPLAAAIVGGAREHGIGLGKTADFDSLTGKGVTGRVDGHALALGNLALLQALDIDPGPLAEQAEQLRGDGQTVILVAVDGQPAGLIGVADPIKQSTPVAIQALHAEGLNIVMLTGDSATTAKAVAAKLGIDEVVAGVLPDQKADKIKALQAQGRLVAMAGDGINDAPALARAQVGIAMGPGTDVAMESAGVTLVKGNLEAIVRARRLSRATMANIRQNLFFAFVYNALGVPVAAGVLYPFFGLLLSPMIAAAAMSFSSVSVIGNALRLNRVRLADG